MARAKTIQPRTGVVALESFPLRYRYTRCLRNLRVNECDFVCREAKGVRLSKGFSSNAEAGVYDENVGTRYLTLVRKFLKVDIDWLLYGTDAVTGRPMIDRAPTWLATDHWIIPNEGEPFAKKDPWNADPPTVGNARARAEERLLELTQGAQNDAVIAAVRELGELRAADKPYEWWLATLVVAWRSVEDRVAALHRKAGLDISRAPGKAKHLRGVP